ncbi:hypothetical protein CR513_14735, partial [Mucuna pruriens]
MVIVSYLLKGTMLRNFLGISNTPYDVNSYIKKNKGASIDYWDALTRLMRYLQGTMDHGIEYRGFPVILEGYSDAN